MCFAPDAVFVTGFACTNPAPTLPTVGARAQVKTSLYTKMDYLLLQLPIRFEEVIDQIKKQDWLISNFYAGVEEIYNPAGYLYNSDLNGVEYKIVLDRNIFRFIVSANKKKNPSEKQRAAISLVTFCQAANIIFEPNLAVYERLLPDRNNTRESVDELILFYKTDNARSDSLMSYSLSESNRIKLCSESRWNADEIEKELTKFQWLNEWKSLYLIVLKLVYYNFQNSSQTEKLTHFMEWLVKDFRLSLVSIVYAIFLFSSKRLKNMVKFKNNGGKDVKLKQLYNMTWDLFFMNNFFRLLTRDESDVEILIASDDKIIKHVLRAAIDVQNEESLEKLKTYLPRREHEIVDVVVGIVENTNNRAYESPEWGPEYREELITKTEDVVLSI